MLPIKSYLPQHDGLLPIWLVFISIVSAANSIQAYRTISYTSRVYQGPTPLQKGSYSNSPVTPLSARTFGTWTLIQSLVRFYAAYHISENAFYQLSFCTFAVAFAHFISEWLIYGSARWGAGLAGPVFVSTGTMLWMTIQWEYYVS